MFEDFTWRVSDCEELVGGYSQEMVGLFCVGDSVEKSGLGNITDILSNILIKILFDYCHLPIAI